MFLLKFSQKCADVFSRLPQNAFFGAQRNLGKVLARPAESVNRSGCVSGQINFGYRYRIRATEYGADVIDATNVMENEEYSFFALKHTSNDYIRC